MVHGATVVTMAEEKPEAEAFSFLEGRVVAVGSESHVRRALEDVQPGWERKGVDLDVSAIGGLCVLPGFVDAHLHPLPCAYYKIQLNLSGVTSRADLERSLLEEDAKLDPGDWLLGFDLLEDNFADPAERVFPDRWYLDEILPGRPVVLTRHDGHVVAVNSATLRAMGLDREGVDPHLVEGGEVRVDERGRPTGVFAENAKSLVYDHLPPPDFSRFRKAAVAFSTELASFGITCAGGVLQTGERGYSGKLGAFEVPLFELFVKEDLLFQDFVLYFITEKPTQLKRLAKRFARLSTRENGFVAGGLKLFADGTFGARTALLHEPFSDDPAGSTGYLVEPERKLFELASAAYEAGFQVITHAIGDAGVEVTLDVYERVLRESSTPPKPARLRIEHGSMVTPKALEKAKRLGVTFVVQPAFLDSEHSWLETRLGSERIKYTYNFRDLLDAGLLVAGASDAPVESASVLKAARACVTRNGFVPEQSISVTEALKMFTINAAAALGQEKVRGSLESGKFADFVLLSDDPRRVPPEDLAKIRILETWRRGRKSFERNRHP
ncbi:MAG: amidohydrolase [Promethearchaeota archaeon]